MTVAQRDLAAFLGKKNFKGIYARNPLARSPDYHKFNKTSAYLTSFPVRGQHRLGERMTDWQKVFGNENAVPSRQPFPDNEFTRTNRRVGEKLRRAVVEGHANGESVQQLSFKLGLSVPRVDAVIRLEAVRVASQKEQQTGSQMYLRKDIAKMSRCMNALFDEIPTDEQGRPYRAVDNLTEIPMPKETRKQLFQSIAESEPFGPVDAAHVLGIEPARTTLDKLTQVDDAPDAAATAAAAKTSKSFYAPMQEGDRFLMRFTDANVGKVGYHYGASRDDQKSARRIRHRADGSQTYPEPEHS